MSVQKDKKKWNIGWGVISNCNMNCQFCYSKDVRKNSKDLSFADWIKFVNENYMYINNINYGTGENAMANDWFTLIDYINKNFKIKQALTTNGYIYERIKQVPKLEEIFSNSISEVDISLDFSEKSLHNQLRGQPNAYDWAIKTLDYCNQNNISPTIVFVGINDTLTEKNLAGLFEIASKYNAKLRMNIFRPTLKDFSLSSKFICEYQRIINAITYINEHYKILSISDPLFSSILTNSYEDDPSGVNSIRILSNGDITPSTYLISEEYVMSNIKKPYVLHNLSDIVVNTIYDTIPRECQKCEHKLTCKGGVYDRRLLWYNSLNERDPYCPYRYGKTFPTLNVKIDMECEFSSIHHGYLPTMFFSP